MYNVMGRLDNLIQGGFTNVVSNAVNKLNGCKRGVRSMEDYVLDYQLRLEKVMSLGRTVDSDYARIVMLEK